MLSECTGAGSLTFLVMSCPGLNSKYADDSKGPSVPSALVTREAKLREGDLPTPKPAPRRSPEVTLRRRRLLSLLKESVFEGASIEASGGCFYSSLVWSWRGAFCATERS